MSPSQRPFIAIDIGTSFIKGAVLDLASNSIHSVQRRPFPEPVSELPANFFEVEPKRLVAEVRDLVTSLVDVAISSSTADAAEIGGLVSTTQMHGLVLTDEAYAPLSNVITWRDQRAVSAHPSGSGSYYDQLLAQMTADEQQQLGNGLRAGLPIGTLFWLAQEGMLPEGAIPLTLSEYVLAQLCSGEVTPSVEPTNAAAYGCYNLESGSWHGAVLERLGLDSLRWPTVGTIESVIGEMAYGGAKFPVYSSVGDHQCSLMGALLQNGELSLNIATGSQVSLITDSWVQGAYETRPYFDNRTLNTLAKIPAGRALNLLVSLLTELNGGSTEGGDSGQTADAWRSISAAVESVTETDLSIDLSFFDSAHASTGAITNIREDNFSVGHLFRAAFQSMAQNYVNSGLIVAGNAVEWERIVFSGGVVQKSAPLRQAILAAFEDRRLPCNDRVCPEQEDTLLGLLVLAYCVSGEAASIAEATQKIAGA